MPILDIFKPTPETIAFGQRTSNLVYRVLFTTAAIFVLGVVAVGIGHAAVLGAEAADVGDQAKQFVKNGSRVLYVVTVTVSWLFGAVDPFRLVALNFFNRGRGDADSDQEN